MNHLRIIGIIIGKAIDSFAKISNVGIIVLKIVNMIAIKTHFKHLYKNT